MHQKRINIPKIWPIPRKGTKYLAVASHAHNKGIPLLFILRELLGIARTKKEVRYILLNSDVKVNNKVRKSEKFPVQFFDTIQLEKLNKNYRIGIEHNKFKLEEISAKEANKKIVKISGKKILSKGQVQMNLEDGQNFLLNEKSEKFAVGDSALLNTKEKKIEKILQLNKNANVEVISGKHSGEKGKLKEIVGEGRKKKYIIKLKDKEVGLPFRTLLVLE